MKNKFIVLILLLFTSCSHNISSYSKGGGVQVSWNPDSFVPSVRAGFYEFLFTMNRQNSNVRYTTNIGMGIGDIFGIANLYALIMGKEPSSSSGSGTSLQIKSGPVMNGYIHKILQNPNFTNNHVQAIKYLTKVDSELPDKQIHVTPFKTSTNVTPTVKTEKGILGDTTVITPVNQLTKDIIKNQINPKSLNDSIREISIYGIIGIIVVIIFIIICIIYLIKRKNLNK